MTAPRWSLSALLVLAVTSLASTSGSALALPEDDPIRVEGPWLLEGTPTVERAEVDVRCLRSRPWEKHDRKPACSHAVTLWLTAPTDAPSEIRALFTSGEAQLAPAYLEKIAAGEVPDPEMAIAHGRFATLTIAPGASVPLVVRGRENPEARFVPDATLDPLETRHRFLAEQAGSRVYAVDVATAALASWDAPPSTTVRFQAADGWPTALTVRRPGERVRAPEVPGRAEANNTLERRVHPEEVALVQLRVRVPGPSARVGGPFFGAGGYLGADAGGFVRAGFEFAAPSPLIWSASLDTDMNTFLSTSATASVATDSLYILPSLGVGAGPTVHIAPDLAIGGRLAVTAQFPLAGVSLHLDYLPTLAADDPRALRVGLIGRVGF